MSDPDNQKHNPAKAHTPKRNSRLMAAADKQADGMESQASESRFHTVFNHSPFGNKIIDSELTVHQANPAVLAMLGLTRLDELVGHKIVEFAHPDHVPEWGELQEELWERKTPYFILETRLVRRDGSVFWCQVTSVLFDDEPGKLGYTSLQDITARKELEDTNQRHYQEQETVLQLVVHDIRSPIANIEALVKLLERGASGSSTSPAAPPQETARLHQMIKQCCQQATVLLKDMLYLGALEATKLEKYRLDCTDFLDRQIAVHRLAAQEKGIALTLESPAKALLASFNPDKFRRVVDNLLTNALKFTPAGGRVSVRLHAHQHGVRWSVQDTGIGIPAELQAHVFDKFSAAARAGLCGESTNGLGLYITHQIVQLHGGKIWLESSENEGTTVFIDLV